VNPTEEAHKRGRITNIRGDYEFASVHCNGGGRVLFGVKDNADHEGRSEGYESEYGFFMRNSHVHTVVCGGFNAYIDEVINKVLHCNEELDRRDAIEQREAQESYRRYVEERDIEEIGWD